jgi:hypothetical protein
MVIPRMAMAIPAATASIIRVPGMNPDLVEFWFLFISNLLFSQHLSFAFVKPYNKNFLHIRFANHTPIQTYPNLRISNLQ